MVSPFMVTPDRFGERPAARVECVSCGGNVLLYGLDSARVQMVASGLSARHRCPSIPVGVQS